MSRFYFHKFAKEELINARDYYDEQILGLGEAFITEVDKCLHIIEKKSLAYPIVKDNIRKAVKIKFPFSILYRINNNSIYILAVMHQKRKPYPYYWSKRIKNKRFIYKMIKNNQLIK